jgi:hypothetical protein
VKKIPFALLPAMLGIVFGCHAEKPRPPPTPPPAAPAAPAAPGVPPLPPVQPGQYTNHVGNPAAGSWGPDGQWQWKDPQSPEADSTWKFLAAAGAGAAGGAALSYMLSKRHFEQKHPGGTWTREANLHDEQTYRDRRGNPISRDEYERRRAQSERDRAAYRARTASQPQQSDTARTARTGQYRDKQGRFISKQEFERRQAQSARDKSRHNNRRSRRR